MANKPIKATETKVETPVIDLPIEGENNANHDQTPIEGETPNPEPDPKPETETETPKVETPKVYTNEKIVALEAQKLEAMTNAGKAIADSNEQWEYFGKAANLRKEIEKEVNLMKQAEHEAEQKAKRDKEGLKVYDFEAAIKEAMQTSPDAELSVREAISAKVNTLRDVLLNLAYSGVKATPKATGTATPSTGEGTRGAKRAAIRALIAPMYVGATRETVAAVGKEVRRKVIQDEGFNDGTANAAIYEYEVELGLKDKS